MDLVRRMAKDMKEPLEIRRYDRFTPIKVLSPTICEGMSALEGSPWAPKSHQTSLSISLPLPTSLPPSEVGG